jgi:ribosomal protein S18 acetylase RimI-like enzyme
VEVHVRGARLTDLDAAVRILARGNDDERGRDDVDYLRNLLFVPSATVAVAELERRVVGVGVLAIRPSVRSGPFVGVIDELGIIESTTLAAAERRRVADEIVEHLATSARNKGCTRVEVTEPLATAEPSHWKRLGFASSGRTLNRPLGRSFG